MKQRKQKRDVLYVAFIMLVFVSLTLFAWLKPTDDFSATERRELAQFPEVSFETIETGMFMQKFESYTLDQFPFRKAFRSLKAITHKYVLRQSDNNDVYLVGNHISKLDYPYRPQAMENTIQKFTRVYEKYMAGSEVNVYAALIPDKNYFLAKQNGYPAMDYKKLYEKFQTGIPEEMKYVEIKDLLELEDYYLTDTHWRQDAILDVAKLLGESMKTPLKQTYETVTLDTPFYGVYYGQLALPVQADKISYLDNPIFADCKVYDAVNEKEIPVYDLELANGRDGYEMFLSGALSGITIENPNAITEKELVMFRDSFGSSIAPLFIEGYQKITLLDIRYLHESMIGEFVEFKNQDVLFLHSTGVVNNETAFKK